MTRAKAIVLLSGGLDSATALGWAQKVKKWDCRCLLFNYGQRHQRELRAARAIANQAGCPVREVRFRLPWGGSSLIDKKVSVPSHSLASIGHGRLPNTYVPARNTIFISFALSWADTIDAENIVIGANALDYSGYPDCRPLYLRAMQTAGRQGTRLGAEKKRPLRLWAPLLQLSKADIIRKGVKLHVATHLTWSCYQGRVRPCGLCDSCRLRAEGFRLAGIPDPASRRNVLS
ncbi:MAG: 7-cyano-7-deazaguanine synthase QueC [Elusimicrobia bacterium]|jgi:7-cyano-7-deazaguanine synthase|nr:7-cyano-7-deazaguanine synthase QueC [Elusimicrobiota bacterium]